MANQNLLQQISDNLWIADGEAVPFLTIPYTTRMTVIKLANGQLWLHSPIRLTEKLQQQIDQLGQVKYLIAPNQLHHLFLKDWQDAYPQAQAYGTKAVIKKRSDIQFTDVLDEHLQADWNDEIAQLLFTGSPFMQEMVFFHQSSKSLIVTDLIENFPAESFSGFKLKIAKFAGILAPKGKMPIDWRSSFLFGKKQARRHLQQILKWQPERIILAHGLIVQKEAISFLKQSFSWLGKF